MNQKMSWQVGNAGKTTSSRAKSKAWKTEEAKQSAAVTRKDDGENEQGGRLGSHQEETIYNTERGCHKMEHKKRMQTQTYVAGSTRYRYYFRSDNTLSMRPSKAKEGAKMMAVMTPFCLAL